MLFLAGFMFINPYADALDAQESRTPQNFVIKKELSNGYSGDGRISLASFHTLLIIDSEHDSHKESGPNTLREITMELGEQAPDVLPSKQTERVEAGISGHADILTLA